MNGIDYPRTIIFFVGLIFGVGLIYFFKDVSINTKDIVGVLVTLFSVLAGFLIAAITFIIGYLPVSLRSKISQRAYRKTIEARINRTKLLFYCYLIVLFLIFLSIVTKTPYPEFSKLVEIAFLGLGSAAIIWSFAIPSLLAQIQKEKLDRISDK